MLEGPDPSMKIYLAGLLQFNQFLTNRGEKPVDHEHILESYHYLDGSNKVMAFAKNWGKPLFLDSGAFTVFTKGASIDLNDYCNFIERDMGMFNPIASLDIIQSGHEAEAFENLKEMRRRGIQACPTHHHQDRNEWLQRYLDEGYDYIFLGGMVGGAVPVLREWLDNMWDKYLCNPDGTAKVKVHGFGLTSFELMFRYPWYSVDSSSWNAYGRYGAVYLDLVDAHGVRYVTHFYCSDKRRSNQRQIGTHWDNMAKPIQEAFKARCEELGYDFERLRVDTYYRNCFNAMTFSRVQDLAQTKFKRPQPTFF